MSGFFQENAGSIVSMVALAIVIIVIQIVTVKNHVQSVDKSRIAKGKAAMTDDEKELAKQSSRSYAIQTALIIMFSYIIGNVIMYML